MKTASVWRNAAALVLGTTLLLGCGGGGNGGGIVPLLVALIRADFVPPSATVPEGGSTTVQLIVRCDRDGLNTAFQRLQLRVKVDPDGLLPQVQATLATPPIVIDAEGFARYNCNTDTPDPQVKQATINLSVTGSLTAPAREARLQVYIEIEPLGPGQPSRDATLAELDLTLPNTPPQYGTNLLLNPAFSGPVLNGTVPGAPGNWTGDAAGVVPAELGITPRSGPTMLKFVYTGTAQSASALVSSQQWQLIDVRQLAADIAAGRVRADAGIWFNRALGTEATDRRFDLRIIAFDGEASTVPARYAASGWLAVQAVSVATAGEQWQQAQAGLVLPAGTTIVMVEVYAYEDVVNDTTGAEFSGHYADDASLVLTLQ